MNSILRITDPIPSDNSIDRYEEIVYGVILYCYKNNIVLVKNFF